MPPNVARGWRTGALVGTSMVLAGCAGANGTRSFRQPGTYVLSRTEHPATALTVNVSQTRRYTCGEQPVAEIHFGTHRTFAPQAVNFDKGQSIQIDNDTQRNS